MLGWLRTLACRPQFGSRQSCKHSLSPGKGTVGLQNQQYKSTCIYNRPNIAINTFFNLVIPTFLLSQSPSLLVSGLGVGLGVGPGEKIKLPSSVFRTCFFAPR